MLDLLGFAALFGAFYLLERLIDKWDACNRHRIFFKDKE